MKRRTLGRLEPDLPVRTSQGDRRELGYCKGLSRQQEEGGDCEHDVVEGGLISDETARYEVGRIEPAVETLWNVARRVVVLIGHSDIMDVRKCRPFRRSVLEDR